MTAGQSQKDFARALLDAKAAPPAGLLAWNGSDPAQRFNVYRNNVMVSLTQALASAFPVTRDLVGDDFFHAMARQYVSLEPPTSPVLVEYGDGFADFIAQFPPADSLPYLADVARLERMRVQAHHAQDAPVLAVEALQALMADAEGLFNLRLSLHPACQVLRSRFAVFSLWTAHQHEDPSARGAALEMLDPGQAEDVIVLRPFHEVGVICLPPGTADFLLALARGQSLGEAATWAASIPRFDLENSLGLLITPGVTAG